MALPACFCALGTSPLTRCPLHSLSPGSWSVDGVTRAGRWGEAQGCLSGRRSQARRASCGFGGWTSARPGEGGGALAWRRAIGRLWGRRSRWTVAECVCAGMEAPRRSRKLHAPSASLPAGLAGSQRAGRKCTVCFSNFKEEGSPWPALPFWAGRGCVYWGGGSAGKPIPGRASVFPGGGVSLQNRRPRSLSLPFCRL